MNRYEIERAAKRAALPGPSFALVMLLCSYMSRGTANIPERYQPSLSALAAGSGYCRATVKNHLNRLERDGWLTRNRPPKWLAQTQHARTQYAVHVPHGYPQARPDDALGHGQEIATARPEASPELGHEIAVARPAASHSQKGESEVRTGTTNVVLSDDDLCIIAKVEMRARAGREIDDGHAAEIVRLVLDGRPVRNRGAYLRRAIREDPRRFLPAASSQPAPFGSPEFIRKVNG
jgi:hypothetical protein